MTVVNYNEGDLFIARTFKFHSANPDLVWSNVYEGVTMGPGGTSDLEAWLDTLCWFETVLHGTAIQFPRGEVGTWGPDSHPYNPDTFMVQEWMGRTGARVLNNPLPLRVTWAVKREAETGRSGTLFYRGCLSESDVEFSGAGYTFTDYNARATEVSDALTSSGLIEYLNGSAGVQLVMAGIPKNVETVQVRRLSGLFSRGPRDVQMNHRWYNRTKLIP